MDIQMTAEDFTFAGVEAMLMNGLTSLIATISVVGLLLLVILEIALGWNYVLGDNAENSHDSRYWADPYVSHEDVIAKLLMPIK